MSDAQLAVKLLLEDKEALTRLKTAFDDIERRGKKSADSANLSWAGLASKFYLAQAALRPLIGFMSSSVQAAIAQEDAVNRLNFALQNQGTYTTALSQQYQAMATSLQASTRFGDEAIMSVQQRLVAIGNVGPEQMEKVTKSVLDFSTATGTELNASALLFAKAAAGNVSALSRYGIVLDESIPKSEKFAALLELVGQRMGGAAAADVLTYGGAVARAGNLWGDLQEELGKAITNSPAVRDMITVTSTLLLKMIEALQKNGGQFEYLMQVGDSTFRVLVVGAAYVVDAFNDIGTSLVGVNLMVEKLKSLFGAGDESFTAELQKQFDAGVAGGGGAVASVQTMLEEINTVIRDNADLINQERLDKELTFEEKLLAQKKIFNEQEYQEKLLAEGNKIEAMRQQWLAWDNERTAAVMAQQQRENEMFTFALDVQKKAHESLWSVASKARDTFSAGMSQALVNMMKGTGTLKEAFADLGWQMIKILTDYIVQLTVNFALAKAMQAAHLATTVPIATSTATAWAPAAALVSLATFGTNAAAAVAGMTSTVATATALAMASAIPGLEEGGTITRPGMTWVGESGKELLNLPRGAQVIPLDRQQGTTIEVNVTFNNPVISSREMADEIAEMIAGKVSEIIDVKRRRL